MPTCCVPNCTNGSKKEFRFFIFPQGSRNEERRNKWIQNVDRPNLPANSYICEVHFTNDQFENNRMDGKRLLKQSAVPTIFDKKITDDISDEANTSVGCRRSLRKRKIKHIEDYDISNEKENKYMRCRSCLSIFKEDEGFSLKASVSDKTVAEVLLMCVPQLTLSQTEYICPKCYKFLYKFLNFVLSCIDADRKLKEGIISLEFQDSENEHSENTDFDSTDDEQFEISSYYMKKKKVGRKRKQDLLNSAKAENENDLQEKIPKKRGRKRKIPLTDEKTQQNEANEGAGNRSILQVTSDTNNKPALSEEDNENDHNYISPSNEDVSKILHCPVCRSNYKTLVGIKNHLKVDHGISEDLQFICDICKIRCIRYLDLCKHKSSHGFPCDLCDNMFSTQQDLENHKNAHPNSYSCPKCMMKFDDQKKLDSHFPLHNLMSKINKEILMKSVSCTICGASFHSKYYVKQHIKMFHECEKCLSKQCAQDCPNKYARKKYIKTLNYKDKSVQESTDSGYFNDPIRRTYSKSFDFKCAFCNVRKITKKQLMEHLVVHANEKEMHSPTLPVRKMHEKTHEADLNSSQHNSTSGSKALHNEQDIAEDHNVTCCICGDSFSSTAILKRHTFKLHIDKGEVTSGNYKNDKLIDLTESEKSAAELKQLTITSNDIEYLGHDIKNSENQNLKIEFEEEKEESVKMSNNDISKTTIKVVKSNVTIGEKTVQYEIIIEDSESDNAADNSDNDGSKSDKEDYFLAI